MADSGVSATAEAVVAGEVRAAARLMRGLDDGDPAAVEVMRRLYRHTGRAFIVGITGNPGSGKSTVVDGLIRHYRLEGQRVGVVAVDPTSPFSGGAILGDRIRMQRHATDEGVFIRSVATRGHLGGLSRSTAEIAAVLDAMGYGIILIETVGVGQDEVEVVSQAETAVVVTVPGLGDDIQALKAGILEIADVLVVNKADRDGADRTVRDLTGMLELRPHGSAAVEILRTIATTGAGIDELAQAIGRHREQAARNPALKHERALRRAGNELREILLDRLRQDADGAVAARPDLVEALVARRTDPYTAAEELMRALPP